MIAYWVGLGATLVVLGYLVFALFEPERIE
ncbi:MAG TPA: potassium-transporting ATPase subunit F [Longimicrobiales bacterium]|nr:potassium-transporting ATPase subunit F [Longimicrobiales bacterium]